MTPARWIWQIVFGILALIGLLLFVFGNALLLKLGVAAPRAAALIEAQRWVWLVLSAACFGLMFLRRPRGRAGWVAPLTVVLVGALAVAGGAQMIPAQHRPAPEAPRLDSGAAARLAGDDWVMGVTVDNEAVAYPWAMIQREFVINDTVGGQPVVIAYCISCNSGLAFSAQQGGHRLRFGVVGVYGYQTLLHDEATGSWWREDGSAMLGPLAGAELEQLPAALLPWADWQSMYPDTRVAIP